jgi:nicotinamidase-related amidase
MLLDVDESQLVLVDYQIRLMPALLDGAAAVANAVRLAQMAALLQVPVFATEQNPSKLGASVPELQAVCSRRVHACCPRCSSVRWKRAWASGCARPPNRCRATPAACPSICRNRLPVRERDTIVLAGCEAHVCLLQTALDLLEDEFDVWVVTDACSSRTERNRDAAFDRLAGAGVELVTTEMVAFEWLRSAEHPDFKAVQALIK